MFLMKITIDNICLEYFGTLRQCEESKIMNSQIFSLQWLSNNNIIVCGENGLLKLFRLKNGMIAYATMS